MKQNFWQFGWERIYPLILGLGLFFIWCWSNIEIDFTDWCWYFCTFIAFGITIAISYAWIKDYIDYKKMP